MLKAVLVDDEILALDLLEAMLKEIGGVEIVGKFLSPKEGLMKVNQSHPDILFLDIEMPEMNGIKVADLIEQPETYMDIVFVTAYDEYALKAFNVGATDYVLKPIDKDRLQKTIQTILNRRMVITPPTTNQQTSLKATFQNSFYLYSVSGEKIKWRTKKVKELCAFLLHHEEPVHKDIIIEKLWPTLTLDKASKILHTTVYQLRKEMKQQGYEDAILFVDDRYSLNIRIDSDIQTLHSILKLSSITSDNVRRLLNLYQEGYLAQEDYSWAVEQRENLQKKVTIVLKKFVQSATDETKVIKIYKDALDKLIELDPWEEQYMSRTIQYYLKQGNQREALNLLKQYNIRLTEEMGVETRLRIEDFWDE
ncbi:response regulator [Bacillus sp. CGMCC 1.16607]|uniref:response regulator n=1 Tax=Bacillus sp. CGMCC 1.16607 TaxID=3351842 RepID=UPI00362BCB98